MERNDRVRKKKKHENTNTYPHIEGEKQHNEFCLLKNCSPHDNKTKNLNKTKKKKKIKS